MSFGGGSWVGMGVEGRGWESVVGSEELASIGEGSAVISILGGLAVLVFGASKSSTASVGVSESSGMVSSLVRAREEGRQLVRSCRGSISSILIQVTVYDS